MQPETTHSKKSTYNRKKIVWGVVCLVGPLALVVVSLLLYAIVNFVVGSSGTEQSIVTTITNILLFLVGAVSVVTMLPGLIVGIILLATSRN